jgi:hypothetical protein
MMSSIMSLRFHLTSREIHSWAACRSERPDCSQRHQGMYENFLLAQEGENELSPDAPPGLGDQG